MITRTPTSTRKAISAPAGKRPTADPATAYAKAVLAGKIIAGPDVRAACQRHVDDLATGPARGLRWDRKAAGHAIGYFRDVLRLNGGEYEGLPYELLPWQCFIIGALFGWMAADGTRRFRTGYIETGKGSGKSPLAAGVGLYGLTADGERRAEIYAGASKKDQAAILFRDAVAMVDQSPALQRRIVKSGSPGAEWNLAYHQTASFFRPISADASQSGPRPHIGLLDEVHEHKDSTVVHMMRAGTKSRRQALIFMITNAGSDRTSVCWEYHDYAVKVSHGVLEDDSFFGFVCSLDEKDDPLGDEACWPKTNPSLQHGLPTLKYLREQVREARGMPGKSASVKRVNFCMWTEAASPWLSFDAWKKARREYTAEQLRGRRCWGGLDLSSTTDLTAFVLLFEPAGGGEPWLMLPHFWLPGDGLHEKADRDRVPYVAWRDAGWLTALPGEAIDNMSVLARVVDACQQYDVQDIGYDRYRMKPLMMQAEREGIALPPMVEVGQGYKDMTPAVEEFERRIINGQVAHNGNPVLTWCAANTVVVKDDAGNRKPSKAKSTGRIDGIAAALIATARTLTPQQETGSVYEDLARRRREQQPGIIGQAALELARMRRELERMHRERQ